MDGYAKKKFSGHLAALMAHYAALDAVQQKSDIEIKRLKAEVEEHSALIDLQHRRSMEATKLWHAAHPDRKDVFPDLGELLGWMLGEMDQLRDDKKQLGAVVRRLHEPLNSVLNVALD